MLITITLHHILLQVQFLNQALLVKKLVLGLQQVLVQSPSQVPRTSIALPLKVLLANQLSLVQQQQFLHHIPQLVQ
jgi:hypothetical protein